MTSRKVIVFVIVLLAIWSALAVDRSKFKTCSQASFCKRNRDVKNGPGTSYRVVPGSLTQVSPTKVEAELLNQNNVPLKMEISAYGDKIAMVKINEKHPLKPRYEVKDFVLEQQETPLKLDDATITLGPNKIFIDKNNNFRMDFFSGANHILTANQRNLFNFEHLINKNAAPPAQGSEAASSDPNDLAEPGEGQNNAGNQDQHWDENFGSHHDSRPNGPTSVAMDFSFIGAKHVYGIPEHSTSFALKHTVEEPYRLFNLDVFEYELDETMALYGSVPLMLAHDATKTSALLWLNAAETWIDVAKDETKTDTHWMSESGIVQFYVLFGPTPADVVAQYASLTGTQALPPLFSIAYHQCRWNYKDQQDVHAVDSGFDEHDIPYDVLWLDIEHTDSKKYFTWDPLHFPDPTSMQNEIAAKGRKMVTIIDPHIKRDGNYYIHTEATEKGLYIKDSHGNDYDGWCWPGSSSYLDFTNPAIRQWWASKFDYSIYKGSTPILYTWNDMNEPSVFNGPEVSMHRDAKHYGGWEHRDVHNVYGTYLHQATAEGQVMRSQGVERPFVLSRAFYAGSQRFGAIWTGDNKADWNHLKYAQPMLLSLGIAGITFSGADVGGFFGNPETELLVRWYQAGAFHPFFRAHAHLDTKRREPWLFGEPWTSHIRKAIKTRYTILPYLYTLFHENTLNGKPIMRPLWLEFPTEEVTFGTDDTFMLGNALLVKPVTEKEKQSVEVYLPGNQPWYDFETGKAQTAGNVIVATPLDKIPVFQRGGTIVPRKMRSRRSSTQMMDDPYTLVVALDNSGTARGELYMDDGHTYEYKRGKFHRRSFVFQNNQLTSAAIGSEFYDSKNTVERVVVLGVKAAPSKVLLKSKGATFELQFDAYDGRLEIRKPNVLVNSDWSIVLQ